ncbi:hypothetical protein CLOSTASPAR_06360 [[Clostridium] asparagiforme DSM 15981]|uniref:Uncharacterized protein n=1 Tax=[Clostridium] asparagiforme DSM 15981 TaxID=518636 RepID=C0DAQ6_9FIRM|nr:hypothetical protein CLOSTASPAR_06360 [[Clostridium] asparagiforme DSM 15981]
MLSAIFLLLSLWYSLRFLPFPNISGCSTCSILFILLIEQVRNKFLIFFITLYVLSKFYLYFYALFLYLFPVIV